MRTFLVLLLVAGVLEAQLLCNLCSQFVESLEKELENDEQSIDDSANKACDSITNKDPVFDKICKDLVDREIDNIIKGIESGAPPDVVCKDVGMC